MFLILGRVLGLDSRGGFETTFMLYDTSIYPAWLGQDPANLIIAFINGLLYEMAASIFFSRMASVSNAIMESIS
jgi:hypothetical protein